MANLNQLQKKFPGVNNLKSIYKRFVSSFRPRQERQEGRMVYFRQFNKQQLPGAIIKTSKKSAFRITAGAELNGQGRMINGEHELIKLKRR